MAKKPKQPVITKKHIARQEREQQQTRFILYGGLIVLILVVGLIGYGILDQTYLQSHKTIATVNGEKIIMKDFQTQVRFFRLQIVNQAQSTYQLMQYFGSDAQTQTSIANQLLQLKSQLSTSVISENVANNMVDDILIRQEAAQRGITVTEDEIDKALEEAYYYFRDGTPTSTPTRQSAPTSTLNPTQFALVPPTDSATDTEVTPTDTTTTTTVITQTATPTVIPSITPTFAPTATATPYTYDAYKAQVDTTIQDLVESINFTESDLRKYFENQLYNQKVKEAVIPELNISGDTEEVWARHILVSDEETALDLIDRLQKGEDWSALAAEYSLDTSNKDEGGDLGWFGKGTMVTEFEEAAFTLKTVGEISEPVQTDYGWHIIQLLGHETRELSDYDYAQLEDEKFQEWMTQLKENADIVINEIPESSIPTEPVFPVDIDEYLNSVMQ